MGRGHRRTGAQRDGATMGRKGTRMGIQWDCGSAGRAHNGRTPMWPKDRQQKTKKRTLYICQRDGHLSKPREREIAGF